MALSMPIHGFTSLAKKKNWNAKLLVGILHSTKEMIIMFNKEIKIIVLINISLL